MDITHVIVGTVDVDSGSGSRHLDIPFGITDPLSAYLSSVIVTDPVTVTEFKLTGFGEDASSSARDHYLGGVRQVTFGYTSTATGPLSVDFVLVFVDVVAPGAIGYGGN
jgi:hypothetical protein